MTLLFILFGFSLLVMVEKGFKPKIFTRKKGKWLKKQLLNFIFYSHFASMRVLISSPVYEGRLLAEG